MMPYTYNFDQFIERMSRLDYEKIIEIADRECSDVLQRSVKVRGAPEEVKKGSLKYLQKVKEFLFYMRSGIRPATTSETNFKKYRIVVEALVEREQYRSDSLYEFDKLCNDSN